MSLTLVLSAVLDLFLGSMYTDRVCCVKGQTATTPISPSILLPSVWPSSHLFFFSAECGVGLCASRLCVHYHQPYNHLLQKGSRSAFDWGCSLCSATLDTGSFVQPTIRDGTTLSLRWQVCAHSNIGTTSTFRPCHARFLLFSPQP
jgi:hypothetical protein